MTSVALKCDETSSMVLFACRYLLSVVKVMEEKKKLKRQRVRAENRVVGLDNDDASDEEAKRRAKLPSDVFTKQDDGKNQGREFPDKKTVLLELFTKSGVAKVEVPYRITFRIPRYLLDRV